MLCIIYNIYIIYITYILIHNKYYKIYIIIYIIYILIEAQNFTLANHVLHCVPVLPLE